MGGKILMKLKKIVLVTLFLITITTIGVVNASNDTNEVISTDIDVEDVSGDELQAVQDKEVVDSSEYVDVSQAYSLLNSFRNETNVWYWNSDDTTKTVLNTNENTQLKALQRDADLEKVAKQRAKEIAESFSHTRPDGSSCFVIYPSKLTAMGENIAYGQNTCTDVTNDWKETNNPYADQGHRRNMLNSDFNCVGIAGFKKNGIIYWVQCFGKSNSINTNFEKTTKIKPVIKPVITAVKKTFKAKTKIKKYTITLKANKKAITNVKVYLKIKGKTFKATTNKKGKATFLIKKLNKKGKYKTKITFKGNSKYKAISKNVIIRFK